MRDLNTLAAAATAVTTGISGVIALWLWWRVDPRAWAWPLLRVGQLFAVLQAAAAGLRYAIGPEPGHGLFYLYALLPVTVIFIAEQLRLASADTVLEARGLEDAQAVGRLPDDEQQSVVLQILRRELGVVAAGALVACFLALRAIGVTT